MRKAFDSKDESRLFYLLSITFSVKWPFFEKKAFGQMNFRSNYHFSEKLSEKLSIICVISVIWLVFQIRFSVKFSKYFRTNDLLINFVFGQMTFFGKMNFRSNGLWLNGDSVKCTFGQMAIGQTVFGQMVFRSNDLSVKNFRWNNFSVKWFRTQNSIDHELFHQKMPFPVSKKPSEAFIFLTIRSSVSNSFSLFALNF
jgi:hypothetical protein